MGGVASDVIARAGRVMLVAGVGVLIAIGASAPAAARAPASSALLEREIADRADELRPFYAARGYRPLWIGANGRPDPAVDLLLARLETAQFDGLDKRTLRSLRTRSARKALNRAMRARDADDVARAEVELSELFVRYARAMRGANHAEMIYESRALAPIVPTATVVLHQATEAASLETYLREMGWMHPLYAPLRDALDTRNFNEAQRRSIWENLDRVRALPATPAERYVLVDAASARLWLYENGVPVDSMRVVVGSPETQTPMMAGFLRHAIVNPYWNIPPDLVQRNIATNVLDRGLGYLKERGYEVLSDWSDKPAKLDPKTIDWAAVAAGARQVRVRQNPGGHNFMGKVKFEFPNAQGIYLHDTPDRHLLKEEDRQLSNGCVRLEDADRFGRWLLGKPLPKAGRTPEQRIELPQLVPVYITYLTAMPTERGIAFREDVYGHDHAPRLASANF